MDTCRDEGQGRDHDAGIIREQQAQLDQVTAMLCEVLRRIENPAVDMNSGQPVRVAFGNLSAEVREWWSNHKRADAKRLQEIRERARAKLTLEELEALGLKLFP